MEKTNGETEVLVPLLPAPEASPPTRTGTLWDNAEFRQLIEKFGTEFLVIAREKVLHQHADNRRASTAILWVIGILAGLMIVAVSILTWYGKVSADAASFLFGVLIAAAFSTMRDIFPRA